MLDQTVNLAPKIHTFPLEAGNNLLVQRKDPNGFIYITLEKGEVPIKYQGAYTQMDFALQDAKRYIQERIEALKDIKKKK